MEYRQEVVSIYNIVESPLNANEMSDSTFNRLVRNIKKDGILTSSVLLMEQSNTQKLMCISGHHRIRASRKAKINKIPAIIIPEIPESKRIALQISHNDIHGEDDRETLLRMIEKIDILDMDMIDDYEIDIKDEEHIIDYDIKPYHYVNVCLMPESAEQLEILIADLHNEDAINYLTTEKNYNILKEVLTKAFKAGFKTAGQAFRSMMDKYLKESNGTN